MLRAMKLWLVFALSWWGMGLAFMPADAPLGNWTLWWFYPPWGVLFILVLVKFLLWEPGKKG